MSKCSVGIGCNAVRVYCSVGGFSRAFSNDEPIAVQVFTVIR